MSESATKNEFRATGRRKTATARVRLKSGKGTITVNSRPLDKYCYSETLVKAATTPLITLDVRDDFDAEVKVSGGGPNGQAGAIAHGMARALEKYNPE